MQVCCQRNQSRVSPVTSVLEVDFFAILGFGFAQNFGKIVSLRVNALNSSNLVASRRFKIENDSHPVYVRHSNTLFAQVTVGLSLTSDMWQFLKAI